MNKKEAEEKIRDAVTNAAVAQYYTAPWGDSFGVYEDGSIGVGQSIGMEIAERERPIALVKCPGLGNIDSSFWTEGWTKFNPDTSEYETKNGRKLDLTECIRDCCENGDISDEKEELIQRLIESREVEK